MADAEFVLTSLYRFGLGPRPGDLTILRDPRGSLRAELQQGVPQPTGPDLLDSAVAITTYAELVQVVKRLRRAMPPPAQNGADSATAAEEKQAAKARLQTPQRPNHFYMAEVEARLQLATAARVGFVERLVWFWSNHFAVGSQRLGLVRITAGPYEREAIRPHVLGRFYDMLLAAETHQSMLVYLDNIRSIGPGSRAGGRRGRGLNENQAREILELHTLGVDSGYQQSDVTSLARILTGWTIENNGGVLGAPGTVVFNRNRHEPGDHRLLDRDYPDGGPEQLKQALLALARHPATARHVVTKFVRYFISDDPPTDIVTRLTKRFIDTDGDLKVLAQGVIDEPDAWSAKPTKLRSPHEFVVAGMRLLDIPPKAGPYMAQVKALGEPLWAPPGPNGFPDSERSWASPEGMKTRLDIASRLGRQPNDPDINALMEAGLGPRLSPKTREAVMRAADKPQAVALLLMSPEFQRR